MYLSVTAIRALAKSNGYVHAWDVMPAKDPAKKRRPFVLERYKLMMELFYSRHQIVEKKCNSSQFLVVYLWSLSTARNFFHCSCDVNWTAAYGMIRAIVAEFPLHRPHRPSLWYVFVKNKMVARNEYGISLLLILKMESKKNGNVKRKFRCVFDFQVLECNKTLLYLKIDFCTIQRSNYSFCYTTS